MAASNEFVYDASRLLSHVDKAESELAARLNVSENFGHPEHPKIELFALGRRTGQAALYPVLAVAYTKHCASTQVLRPTNHQTLEKTRPESILQVCKLGEDGAEDTPFQPTPTEDEIITCVRIVGLEDHTLVSNEQSNVTVAEKDDDSSSKVILRGILSGNENLRLAIVVGTNKSRLLSAEFIAKRKTWRLQRQSDLPNMLFEVLPVDGEIPVTKQHDRAELIPFRPRGGVSNLSVFRLSALGKHAAYLFIAYEDGSVIRLHHAGVFPSVWKKGAEQGLTIDGLVKTTTLLRYRVNLPPDEIGLNVVPMPVHHPSIFSPASTFDLFGDGDEEKRVSRSTRLPLEAVVCGTQSSSDLFPAIVFYSSEVQFVGHDENAADLVNSSEQRVLGKVVGGTKALVSGVIGALRWGLSSGAGDDDAEDDKINDDNQQEEEASTPFPSLFSAPVELFAAHEVHDVPRRVEFCTVDPDGAYAAVCDTLGRVLLFDLATKQLIKLWKGLRDAKCYWSHALSATSSAIELRLVIHSGHRHVVEIWKVSDMSKISAVQVGREAQLIPCTLWSQATLQFTSFLIHSTAPGAPDNIIESVEVSLDGSTIDFGAVGTTAPSISSRSATLRLQHLQQLLSSKSVQFTKEDIYSALADVQVGDLSTALDLIASTTVIEENIGDSTGECHKVALAHCKSVLDDAKKSGNDEMASNPHMKTLARNVNYHVRLAKVFEVLHRYEYAESTSQPQPEGEPSFWWAAEAIGWVKTYEHCRKVKVESVTGNIGKEPLRLSTLFASCMIPKVANSPNVEKAPIRFSESSRTRRDILVHVYKPLLGDIFSLNVVYTIFDSLGIREDTDYILRCFGEWFVRLSKKEIYSSLLAANPPMTRFLRDLATRQLQSESSENEITLSALHTFCVKSSDLVRCFMLAALCRDAVAKASAQKERFSYGKVMSRRVIEHWDKLLRQLRVCLLVSLRLDDQFQAPLSIELVDEGELFSVYEWLARDELLMSHDQEEIALLEQACAISSHSFDPSTPEGDGPAKFKILQNSCLASQISEQERSEYLVDFDDDDRFGALLLFLKSHNNPILLAAHRALLLCNDWAQDPSNLNNLQNCFMALNFLCRNQNNRLTAAVATEIWRRCANIFRAQLFGWDDVQGVREDLVAPLLENQDWSLPFGRLALKFLRVLRETNFDTDDEFSFPSKTTGDSWPKLIPDTTLDRLLKRLNRIETSAVDTHCVIICALLVSNNIPGLVKCVPSINECFLHNSLIRPFVSDPDVSSLRLSFVEDAVVARAKACPNMPLDSFSLQEIETLAHVWVIEPKFVRSIFLLAMYELEKDRSVDELVTKSVSQIDSRSFVEHGVDIVCRRLNSFLNGERMSTTSRRNAMGLLDADLCDWIELRAEDARWLVESLEPSRISIEATTIMVMRLAKMSSTANVDPSLRTTINSMIYVTNVITRETIR